MGVIIWEIHKRAIDDESVQKLCRLGSDEIIDLPAEAGRGYLGGPKGTINLQ